jgi:hypothetical protein
VWTLLGPVLSGNIKSLQLPWRPNRLGGPELYAGRHAAELRVRPRQASMSTRLVPTPLFTRDELAAAFELLLPAEKADTLATRWWEEFAYAVDADGRFLYPGTWGTPRPIDEHEGTLNFPPVDGHRV